MKIDWNVTIIEETPQATFIPYIYYEFNLKIWDIFPKYIKNVKKKIIWNGPHDRCLSKTTNSEKQKKNFFMMPLKITHMEKFVFFMQYK